MAAGLPEPPPILKLLAHDLRWALLRALAVGDYRVQELVDMTGQPMNLISYHLKLLRAGTLVSARRSDADGRDVYYTLDLDHLQTLYSAAGRALHPTLMDDSRLDGGVSSQASAARQRVLFVCTQNSARSQMAEALTRELSGGHVAAFSAGSQPTAIHAEAISTMAAQGIDMHGQRSKSFAEFSGQSFDLVITVCDHAREICPIFPGSGQRLHWSFPDPAAVQDAAQCTAAFAATAARLRARIGHLLAAGITLES